MPDLAILISALATLFVTIDPPGLVPIFIGTTQGMNDEQKRSVIIRSTLAAFAVLCAFALVGSALLSTLGISLDAFKISGGLLLFYVAFEMIFEKRQERHQKTVEKHISDDEAHDIAIFPLAMPMIAGPGAISAAVLLSGELSGALGTISLLAILATIIGLVALAFSLSSQINRLLGRTGRALTTRLLGVLLAALAVQFVGDGITGMIELTK